MRFVKSFDKRTDLSMYQKHYSEDSIQIKRFYNIGAGAFSHPCWTNIDGDSEFFGELYGKNEAVIKHDLFSRVPIPVADNSAEIIYTSHTIEHIDDASVIFLLKECYRMLKPGGIIRIVTPDLDKLYNAWLTSDTGFFYWKDQEQFSRDLHKFNLKTPLSEASLTQVFIEVFAAQASEIVDVGAEKRISDEEFIQMTKEMHYEDVLTYCTSLCNIEIQKKFPYQHMSWFNENKLGKLLKNSGFNNIVRSDYLKSAAMVMRNKKLFDSNSVSLSLYMEATK
jgi:SAM-dependent methyltransferase